MRITKSMVVVLVVIAVIAVGFIAYSMLSGPGPACTTTWKCAAPYPLQVGGTFGVAGQQCGASSTNVYCVGGVDADGGPRSEVFTATVSASGNITQWVQSRHGYPQDVTGEACAASSGYVYCLGGIHDDAGDDISSSYFASFYGNGSMGPWQPTTAYPIPIDSQSCVAWSSRIYCVGGNNETAGSVSNVAPSSSDWYATIGPAGIGNWTKTTPYPAGVYVPICYETGGYIYCIGGSDSNGDPLGTAYYAPLTATGVGEWTVTTTYPVASSGPACVMVSGYIYCVGGETGGGQSPSFTDTVYYARISSGGIGPWTQGASYPNTIGTACVAAQGNVYCVGGFDESSAGEGDVVNYASITSISG
jgi:hypothetical protein